MSDSSKTKRAKRRPILWVLALVVVVVLVVLFMHRDEHQEEPKHSGSSLKTAGVVAVQRRDLAREVEIPAEFRAYVDVDLHAKVSGYLQKINVDFGDRVKSGQLLAVLEVPELKDELDSARAAEQKAEADYHDQHLNFTRMQKVNKEHPNLVAEQDIDNAEAKDATASAAVTASKADVERYNTLFGYTQITAPFDGVVTARYADPGALIEAGTSSGQARPVLRVGDNYHLRLDFPVSVDYVKYIREGDPVQARVDSLGGKIFTGPITRFTREVSENTRTMTTEIEIANPQLELTPGMYAAVLLQVQHRTNALAVPIEAVPRGPTPRIMVVNKNNEIEEKNVTLGIETPNYFEVVSGLNEGDRVVVGNRREFHAGQKVEPKVLEEPSLPK